MAAWLQKYWILVVAIFCTLLIVILSDFVFNYDVAEEVQQINAAFQKKELALDQELRTFQVSSNKSKWTGTTRKSQTVFLFVYQDDTLTYWNTNQVPVPAKATNQFPTSGIIRLKNGWYYAKSVKNKNKVYSGAFLIKQGYAYENNYLVNDFEESLRPSFPASISLDKSKPNAVKNKKGKTVFSIVPSKLTPDQSKGFWFTMLLLLTISLWLMVVFHSIQAFPWWGELLVTIVLLSLRLIWIKKEWLSSLKDLEYFQATLYGSNEWFPNLFEFIVNVLFIHFTIRVLLRQLKKVPRKPIFRYLHLVLLSLCIPAWMGYMVLVGGMVENSSIPLVVDRLFDLEINSFIVLFFLGFLLLTYYQFVKSTIEQIKDQGITFLFVFLWSCSIGFSFFLYGQFYTSAHWLSNLFPLLFLIQIVLFTYRNDVRFQLGLALGSLALVSVVLTFALSQANVKKEKAERELFANQLATEQDIVTEVEYQNVVPKLMNDSLLNALQPSKDIVNYADFQDRLETQIFNGFWERYELRFHLFEKTGVSLFTGTENQEEFSDLNTLIKTHGNVSEIDPNVYFIEDYTRQLCYVIRQPLNTPEGKEKWLFISLKSKKIPEEIGFPRLLITKEANVFESLENYAIAKYHNNRLIKKFGRFNFPSTADAIKRWKKMGKNYVESEGYSHYKHIRGNELLILSTKNITWKENLTAISYLFCFYGIMLLPQLFQFTYIPFFRRGLSISTKIQITLIGLVFLSLLAFSYGSGLFVSDQYSAYSNELIREKLESVELELRAKLGIENRSTLKNKGNYLDNLLQKLSKVFNTDINLFNENGQLSASSRPKVFKMGLLSEQMNPLAVDGLMKRKDSEFSHVEQIGQLEYVSAYIPLVNNDGTLLGFINLQQFGQQQEIEEQIQQFLVSIINVFMLLLALSVVLALLISNWVTVPLRIIQDNFKLVSFGKQHEKINYDKEDEIGALVRAYNVKLEELALAAEQLALSERESAWRDMAKQVAHEIKNPLTPMKLSVQHLLRTFDRHDPNVEEKLRKVVESLIEQIDALTAISNEFSNFAKMPLPEMEVIELSEVIKNVVSVFEQEENCTILLDVISECPVLADRDQIVRVFNNLIKNAIQAIPSGRKGTVEVLIKRQEDQLVITVKDNGKGIPDEMKNKLFIPYFTTKSTGSGIGLAVVKQIIENHNGKISFSSEVNVGTTFRLVLPAIKK